MKKVLIITASLQIGGAERVAANISKYAPKDEFEFHYLVFEGLGNVFGAEIEAAGGKVFTIPSPSKGYAAYIRRIYELIRKNKYSVVHSHTQFNSGLNLAVARLLGVPVRIAHSHTTRTERKVSFLQKGYEHFMRLLIKICGTDLFACGIEAGYWMFGKKDFDRKGVVISNGIDTEAFSFSEEACRKIRGQYAAQDRFIIGHSGVLSTLKNQELLIRLLPEIMRKRPNSMLMFLGRDMGCHRSKLEQLAMELHLSDRVVFCGPVNNVSEYLSAFDVFAFPSLREGTPLAVIEAQTNGLPCVISDRIPRDVHLTDLICALPLEAESAWVEQICRSQRSKGNYAEQINSQGYGCHQAYEPVYHAYSR